MTRPIVAHNFEGVEPGFSDCRPPEFLWVDPTHLLVDESYQRELTKRSIVLIRKIVSDWDWRRFKPPVVVETDDGYEVIDGQHTAIAAASHPSVPHIPVMIVDAEMVTERASAFIGHNRDRLQMTKMQLHHAGVAAGDERAMQVERACRLSGVRVVKYQPQEFMPGDTMAVKVIGDMIDRYSFKGVRKILDVLVAGGCAPIRAEAVKAVAALLNDPEYHGEFTPEALSDAIKAAGEKAYIEAKVYAAENAIPMWRALTIKWYWRRKDLHADQRC